MKTIKQIREEYDNRFLNLVESLPEEIMLEGKGSSPKFLPTRDMPMMILFRRIQYRIFPDKQVVGLYYSKTMNKYLSIPFGPDGNLNLSESIIHDDLEMLEEDWSDVKHQNPTGGLKKSGVMAYRRENPGSKLQTAVTTKPSKLKPGSKAANRRKSFCARMGGMKKRLTSAKTANDPDSRINKALRKWNCEESFRQKLEEKRQERLDEFLPLVAAAGEMAAGAIARSAIGAGARSVASNVARRGLATTARVAARRVARSPVGKFVRNAGRLGKWALKSAMTDDSKDNKDKPQTTQSQEKQNVSKIETPYGKTKTFTSGELSKNRAGDTEKSIESQAVRKQAKSTLSNRQRNENKISDIRNMLNEGVDLMNLSINGRTVTLNNSMAKRIVEVYDSVNIKNKKIVEGMLNDDLDSFKRLLNFSIKV